MKHAIWYMQTALRACGWVGGIEKAKIKKITPPLPLKGYKKRADTFQVVSNVRGH